MRHRAIKRHESGLGESSGTLKECQCKISHCSRGSNMSINLIPLVKIDLNTHLIYTLKQIKPRWQKLLQFEKTTLKIQISLTYLL